MLRRHPLGCRLWWRRRKARIPQGQVHHDSIRRCLRGQAQERGRSHRRHRLGLRVEQSGPARRDAGHSRRRSRGARPVEPGWHGSEANRCLDPEVGHMRGVDLVRGRQALQDAEASPRRPGAQPGSLPGEMEPAARLPLGDGQLLRPAVGDRQEAWPRSAWKDGHGETVRRGACPRTCRSVPGRGRWSQRRVQPASPSRPPSSRPPATRPDPPRRKPEDASATVAPRKCPGGFRCQIPRPCGARRPNSSARSGLR